MREVRLPHVVRDGKLTQSQYRSLHQWVSRELGKPKDCWKCKDTTKKVYDWANISGEYKKDLKDWERLCRACHFKKDFGGKDLSHLDNTKPYCKRGHKMEGDNVRYKLMHDRWWTRYCHACNLIHAARGHKKVAAAKLEVSYDC